MEIDKKEYWRDLTRKQLGVSIQLFIGFAGVSLGFMTNVMLSHSYLNSIKIIFNYGSTFILFSILIGSIAVVNRLIDFRKTAQLYRDNKTEPEVEKETKLIGLITWILFYAQMIFLLIGITFYCCVINEIM